MRVHVVDPSAYTPPYDHALCEALGRAGADVELFTSRFAYGAVAPARGYARRELFYRAAIGAPGSRARRAVKLAEHVPDMLRYRRAARTADVVHFQWLSVQHVDGHLLPSRRRSSLSSAGVRGAAGVRRPLVLTAHDVLPREPRRGQLAAQRRLYERFDAIVVHSEHGRARLTGELGIDAARVEVIPHGAFTHLASASQESPTALSLATTPPLATAAALAMAQPSATVPAPATDCPVVLCFGLMRPYKGIDVLLEAWRGVESAELWIVGMPKMDISRLRASAPPGVRFDARFIDDAELSAYFRRADLVVLPYLEADQSGVLFTALAFGKPLLLSDVGGFPEIAARGAAHTVPAGDAVALGEALRELLGDPAALADLARRAREAADGPYSWDAIADAHLRLYERLRGE